MDTRKPEVQVILDILSGLLAFAQHSDRNTPLLAQLLRRRQEAGTEIPTES